jgi:hypothetical protein
LTRSVRATLAPPGLEATLLATRNACRCTGRSAERPPRLEAPDAVVHSTSGTSRTLSLVVIPRQLVQRCLGSARARPVVRPCLSAPRDLTSQRCVRPTAATHMSKTRTRYSARLSATSRVATATAEGRCVTAATARFGPSSAAHARVFFPRGLATKPVTSGVSVTLRGPPARVQRHSEGRDRFHRDPT